MPITEKDRDILARTLWGGRGSAWRKSCRQIAVAWTGRGRNGSHLPFLPRPLFLKVPCTCVNR